MWQSSRWRENGKRFRKVYPPCPLCQYRLSLLLPLLSPWQRSLPGKGDVVLVARQYFDTHVLQKSHRLANGCRVQPFLPLFTVTALGFRTMSHYSHNHSLPCNHLRRRLLDSHYQHRHGGANRPSVLVLCYSTQAILLQIDRRHFWHFSITIGVTD